MVPILLFLFPFYLFFFFVLWYYLTVRGKKKIWNHNCINCCYFRLSLQSPALSSPDGQA